MVTNICVQECHLKSYIITEVIFLNSNEQSELLTKTALIVDIHDC